MKSLVQPDLAVLNLIAPSGGVTSDVPIMIGDLCVIPVTSAAEGEPFAGRTRGVFRLPKVEGAAFAPGLKLQWDVSARELIVPGSTEQDFGIGCCIEAVGDSDTHAKVAVDYFTRQGPVAFQPDPPPILEARQAPGVSVVTQFQSGHGWSLLGGTTGNLNDAAAGHVAGTQCAWFSGNGNNSATGMRRTNGPAFDLTGKDIGILVRVDEPNQILVGGGVSFILYIGNGGFTNYITFDLTSTSTIKFFPRRNTSDESFGGSWVYFTVATDVQTNSYTAKSGAQTVPQILANVTDWQLLHRDPNPSTPARISLQEIFLVPKQTTYPNGVCCLTFDDGYASCITKAAPIIEAVGGRATAYLIQDQIGHANYMTLAQAKQLQSAYGWTVGSHSYLGIDHEAGSGTGFTDMTEEACTEDIQQVRRWLHDNGFTGFDHLAYPHGAYCVEQDGDGNVNDRVDETLAPVLKTARTLYSKCPETIPPADRMKLRTWVSTSNVTALATLQTCADVCKRTQGCMIVVFHDIVDSITGTSQWLETDLQAFVAYLDSLGIPLRTIDEVFT